MIVKIVIIGSYLSDKEGRETRFTFTQESSQLNTKSFIGPKVGSLSTESDEQLTEENLWILEGTENLGGMTLNKSVMFFNLKALLLGGLSPNIQIVRGGGNLVIEILESENIKKACIKGVIVELKLH
jgi:hypothetical protein